MSYCGMSNNVAVKNNYSGSAFAAFEAQILRIFEVLRQKEEYLFDNRYIVGDPRKKELLELLMPPAAVEAFGAWFLHENTSRMNSVAIIVPDNHAMSPLSALSRSEFSRFPLDPKDIFSIQRGYVRRINFHPQTEEQLRVSMKNARKFPEIEQTFRVMQSFIIEYLNVTNAFVRDGDGNFSSESYSERFLDRLSSYIAASSSNDFFHIGALGVALSPGIERARDENRPLVGKDLAQGVAGLFGDYSGFTAYRAEKIVTCPWSAAQSEGSFARLWNTRWAEQPDGSLRAQKELGGFFNMVMGILYPERYPQYAMRLENSDVSAAPAL